MGQENTNKTLTMKDTNGKTITEEEFMKDIGHGVERTQENWKEEFNTLFGYASKVEIEYFISTLLAEERKNNEILVNTIIDTKNREIEETRNAVLSEVGREVEKKQYYSDDGQQYVTSIEDISTIISNLRVK